jgi:hypothetical protein
MISGPFPSLSQVAWASDETPPQKIEASFDLPNLQGNPFDFTVNDVRATFVAPGGQRLAVPAFFDGDSRWRVRLSPRVAGDYKIDSITRNGKPIDAANLDHRQFTVAAPVRGFVGIDPHNPMRFVHDDGSVYYPLGYNLGWRDGGGPALPDTIARMGQAGANWSRIWMCHWDGKNLDWTQKPEDQPPVGELSLSVARQWDDIIDAAAASGVYLQIVLQHHGQYSTRDDPNWQDNPWNKAKGGWLGTPADFFTDAKARALTKSKYRYIIARWGYSPAILAWELFNEVENTGLLGRKDGSSDAVIAWHAEMAAFLREQDPYHHLITTSSYLGEPRLWNAVDYYQPHAYPPDMLSAIAGLESQQLTKPYFFGEVGAAPNSSDDPGGTVHRAIWGSLMSQSSGAAQYWFWSAVQSRNLLAQFTTARGFSDQSKMLNAAPMHPIHAMVTTPHRGPLRFGPGRDWGVADSTDFVVHDDGSVDHLGTMPAYLQGSSANRAMFPEANFHVNYPADGTFAVRVDQITPQGAQLHISVDGHEAAMMDIEPPPQPAANPRNAATAGPGAPPRNIRINTTLEVPISAGPHTIHLENTGGDWLRIRDFTLTPYVAELAVLGKSNRDSCVLWAYQRDRGNGKPISATISIADLSPGNYRVKWWDTAEGKVVSEQSASNIGDQPLELTTPPIASDLAAWIECAQ